MSRIALFAVALAASAPASAGVPLYFSHHGRLLDSGDQPVDATLDFTVRFHKKDVDATDENNLVWETTVQDVKVTDGAYSFAIGPVDETKFDGIEQRWMAVRVEGDTAEMSPRLRVGSVPFALRALDADTLGSHGVSYYAKADHVHWADANSDFADAVGDVLPNSAQWDTAYTERNRWDGGATGLDAAAGRASLGLGALATASAVAGGAGGALTDGTVTNADLAAGAFPAISGVGALTGLTVNGAVGIGTSSPGRPLHVAGSGHLHALVESTGGNGVAGIDLKNSQQTTERWYIQADSNSPTGGGLAFHDAQRSAYRLVINNVGDVGVGTVNPGAKLEVVGGDNSFRWSGDHSAQNYIRIGRVQIAWGDNYLGGTTWKTSASAGTITFPAAFNAPPVVTGSPGDPDATGYTTAFQIKAITNTNFTVWRSHGLDPEDGLTSLQLKWIAIGTWQ